VAWDSYLPNNGEQNPRWTRILSAYLTEGVLQGVHDWGSGQSILVVLQREVQTPGTWRLRWLYAFDNRLKLADSSFATRCSFTLNNALPTELHFGLHLPVGVTTAFASRNDLGRTVFTGKFQVRYPNNMGYIAISRAGLNSNKTEAIFYVDHFCGQCGGGRYVLMRKVNGIWKVIGELYTWIS